MPNFNQKETFDKSLLLNSINFWKYFGIQRRSRVRMNSKFVAKIGIRFEFTNIRALFLI